MSFSRPIFAVVTLIALAIVVQAWFLTGGGFRRITPTPSEISDYDYSQMAEAFLHGQLSLRIKPSPALLALPNPYDPALDRPYALRDAVLYKDRYYFYWGPVPALFLSAACWAMGIDTPHVSEQALRLPYLFGQQAVIAILIFRIRSKLFPQVPLTSVVVPILSFALGMPLLYDTINLSGIATAVLAGQFFLVGGLLLAWLALEDPSRKPRAGLLALTGVCWSLSVGSRVNLPPAIFAVTAVTLWHLWRRGKAEGRFSLAAMASLLAPLAAGAALFAWYNYARFHSVFEFGYHYQLTGRDQTHFIGSGYLSPVNIPQDLFLYLFRPPQRWHTFPYLVAIEGRPWLRQFFRISHNFDAEPVVGLIWTQPFLLVALAAVGSLFRRKSASMARPHDRNLEKWLILTLCAGLALGSAAPLSLDCASMRYVLDAIPLATILAALGYWHILEYLPRLGRPRINREFFSLVRLVLIFQTVIGFLAVCSYRPEIFTAPSWLPRL